MPYINEADWGKCIECGQCLVKCPVMKMEKTEAVAAIRSLIQGKEVPRVFEECTYCFNCNRYCPVEGLRPHELILQRTLERKKRVPAVFSYLSNGMGHPSIFTDIYGMLNERENRILDRWSATPPPSREILWVGCVGKISCLDLDNSKVLKQLPKYGPRDLCCGELAYRLGSWETYEKTIERTLERFSSLNIERMVCYCGSCYNYFSSILPKVYGKKLPFELISMYQWLLEKAEGGELAVRKPLNFRAAVHESCYVTELERDFPSVLRKLYSLAGMDIVELPHHGDNNLSCGALSFVRSLNPLKSLIREQRRKFADVGRVGADQVAVNCPGCYITLSLTSPLYAKKLRYMPDELLEAFGDDITMPIGKRLMLFVRAFMLKSPKLLLSSVVSSESD